MPNGELTKEDLMKINNAMPSEAKYGDVFEAIAQAAVSAYRDFLAEKEGLVTEIPYSTDCHLDAGVYDSLLRRAFIEGIEAQHIKDMAHEEQAVAEAVKKERECIFESLRQQE